MSTIYCLLKRKNQPMMIGLQLTMMKKKSKDLLLQNMKITSITL